MLVSHLINTQPSAPLHPLVLSFAYHLHIISLHQHFTSQRLTHSSGSICMISISASVFLSRSAVVGQVFTRRRLFPLHRFNIHRHRPIFFHIAQSVGHFSNFFFSSSRPGSIDSSLRFFEILPRFEAFYWQWTRHLSRNSSTSSAISITL